MKNKNNKNNGKIKMFFKKARNRYNEVRGRIDPLQVYRFLRNAGAVIAVLGLILTAVSKTARFLFAFAACFGIAGVLYGLSGLGLKYERWKKPLKVLQIIVAAVTQFVILSFIVITAVTVSFGKSDLPPKLDYVIVPGAAVDGDEPGDILWSRIVDTADYMRQYGSVKAILCGKKMSGDDISEAECMRRELVKAGIAENRLIIEDKSHDTEQNMRNAKKILDEIEGEKEHLVLIISNEYHLLRCSNLAKKVGMRPFVFRVNTPNDAMIIPNSYVREYFSNIIYGVELIFRR